MKVQNNELLKVKGLNTVFKNGKQKHYVLRDISFSLNKNEILAIVGESGSGKSMLMKSIIGLLPTNAVIEQGQIILNNNDITQLIKEGKNKIRGSQISMIFQDQETSLNPLKTIGFHIGEILKRYFKYNKLNCRKKTEELLKLVGIENASIYIDKYPHELSGGMKQRVLIAMALACNSQIIIADEPTTALDVTIQSQILNLLRLLKSNNKSVLFITHDLSIASSISDRILVMYGSRIMEEMLVKDMFLHASHPYTKALLKTIPTIGIEPLKRFETIKGAFPSIENIGSGCPFYNRCVYAKEICKETFPKAIVLSKTHYYYCHK